MNHYFNITLLSDSEMPSAVLMNTICAKLHKVIYDLNTTSIGISFPRYHMTLGNVLRLHGSAADLEKIHHTQWLGGLNCYCHFGEIMTVPDNAKYRTISRKQPTMSPAKMRRLQKRGSIIEQELKGYKIKMLSKGMSDPYLDLVSHSTGHRYRRYIEFGELLDAPVGGNFDQFGFSKTATVPWF